MANPTIMVTGASRGLGAATARLAARLGANVLLLARSSGESRPLIRDATSFVRPFRNPAVYLTKGILENRFSIEKILEDVRNGAPW